MRHARLRAPQRVFNGVRMGLRLTNGKTDAVVGRRKRLPHVSSCSGAGAFACQRIFPRPRRYSWRSVRIGSRFAARCAGNETREQCHSCPARSTLYRERWDQSGSYSVEQLTEQLRNQPTEPANADCESHRKPISCCRVTPSRTHCERARPAPSEWPISCVRCVTE